jgi:hypothetical protein
VQLESDIFVTKWNTVTRFPNSSHTEILGVSHVERVCSEARIALRRIEVGDVEIDRFIEVVEGSVDAVVQKQKEVRFRALLTQTSAELELTPVQRWGVGG